MILVDLYQYQNKPMKLRENWPRTLVSLKLNCEKACAAVAS